ncbi:MAG TPA: SRPBCC family protein [Acidimicrobiales bacterium]
MDLRASLEADCTPEVLFEWVGALDTYDRWLDIVPRTAGAAPIDGDPGPAWEVTLRGRLGPLARSKRLRMVRTEHRPPVGDEPGRAVFERRETDGRDHATWRLGATVDATATGSRLVMDLHYGGTLWVPLLDRVLSSEIDSSRRRLRALVES